MPRPGPRTISRYSEQFKATAVRLSQLPGVRVQDVVASLAFSGLSALSVVVLELSKKQWRADLTTGLWLVFAWSFGTFFFSVLPLLLIEFRLATSVVIGVSSFLLGIYTLLVAGTAFQRDWGIRRNGGEAPLKTMIIGLSMATLLTVGLLANSLQLLPGEAIGWYLVALTICLVYAVLPMVNFLLATTDSS